MTRSIDFPSHVIIISFITFSLNELHQIDRINLIIFIICRLVGEIGFSLARSIEYSSFYIQLTKHLQIEVKHLTLVSSG